MAYTYTITKDLLCIISNNNAEIDVSGPWESELSASTWASLYVNELNIISNEEE